MDDTTPSEPKAPKQTIEQQFMKNGVLDEAGAQAYLKSLQTHAGDLPVSDLQDAITLTRLLRRTNTGPAAARKKTAKAIGANTILVEPEDILNLG